MISEPGDKHVGYSVAVDAQGNIYVTGASSKEWGSPLHRYSGGAADCFVAKLNYRGELQWNTFLGGANFDTCRSIALDKNLNVYVTGQAGSLWGPSLRIYSGGSSDCFVAKLDNKGVLEWNTFLGGEQFDGGYGMAINANGSIYIAGNSFNTWGTPIAQHSGNNIDVFVAQLDENGQLNWNTFLGGKDYDGGYAIALDPLGNVYVSGESSSQWGTPLSAFVQGDFGNYDAFVAKLDDHGILQWNTFFGGTGSDYGRGIVLDIKGNIYVTGNSNAKWGNPLAPYRKDDDIFVVKLDEKGGVLWNTFSGGEGPDYSRGIAVNWTGNIFVTGQSSVSWGKPIEEFKGEKDIFTLKLDDSGAVQWNTFSGSSGSGFGHAITTDGIGNIYLSGENEPSPVTSGQKSSGRTDVFAAKLNNAGYLKWVIPFSKTSIEVK